MGSSSRKPRYVSRICIGLDRDVEQPRERFRVLQSACPCSAQHCLRHEEAGGEVVGDLLDVPRLSLRVAAAEAGMDEVSGCVVEEVLPLVRQREPASLERVASVNQDQVAALAESCRRRTADPSCSVVRA